MTINRDYWLSWHHRDDIDCHLPRVITVPLWIAVCGSISAMALYDIAYCVVVLLTWRMG